MSHVTRRTTKWSCYDQDVLQKQLITWPKMREEETGNPAATLSPVKISTILESNQPTSFLFCFKNCFSVSAEGLKRPTWYYRMCSLSPYGVAVGFFYDTTSRITVVVEASKRNGTAMNLQYSGFCCCCCFVFFLRKLNRFIVSFLGFFFVLFCFVFQIWSKHMSSLDKTKLTFKGDRHRCRTSKARLYTQ